jgi:excisionase family DNA binding protein
MTPPACWLTTAELALELDVNTDTVRRWCRQGRVPATRIGGRYRIDRHALAALLEPSAPPPPPRPVWLEAVRTGRTGRPFTPLVPEPNRDRENPRR